MNLTKKIQKLKNERIFSENGKDVYYGSRFSQVPKYVTKKSGIIFYFKLVTLLKKEKKGLTKRRFLFDSALYQHKKNLCVIGKKTKYNFEKSTIDLIKETASRDYFPYIDKTKSVLFHVKNFNNEVKKKIESYIIEDYVVFIKARFIHDNEVISDYLFSGGHEKLILLPRNVPVINVANYVSRVYGYCDENKFLFDIVNDHVFSYDSDELAKTELVFCEHQNKYINFQNYVFRSMFRIMIYNFPINFEDNKILKLIPQVKLYLRDFNEDLYLSYLMDISEYVLDLAPISNLYKYDALSIESKTTALNELLYFFIHSAEQEKLKILIEDLFEEIFHNFEIYVDKQKSLHSILTDILYLMNNLGGRIIDIDIDKIKISHCELSSDVLLVLIKIAMFNRDYDLYSKILYNQKLNLYKIESKLDKDFRKLGVAYDKYKTLWNKCNTEKLNKIKVNNESESIDEFILSNMNSSPGNYEKTLSNNQQALLCLAKGEYNKAINIYNSSRITNLSGFYNSNSALERLMFLYQSRHYFKKNKTTQKNRYILDLTLNCMNGKSQLYPMLGELRKKGYNFLSAGISQNLSDNDCHSKLRNLLSQLSYDMVLNSYQVSKSLEIDLDIENKSIQFDGIEMYHGFYERVVCTTRSYDFDLNLDFIRRFFLTKISSANTILCFLKQLERLCANEGFEVIVVGTNSHVAPYSCIRDYILTINNPSLQYVTIGASYENYFSKFGNKFSQRFGIVNQTKNKLIRAPFLPERERFEKWFNQTRVDKIPSAHNNVKISSNKDSNRLIKIIAGAKECDQKIICCFGKIVFDSGVPFDGGPAHNSFKEWLNNTIDIAKKNDKILLLIKPHPHELKVEITMKISQYLKDLINIELPENVIFLGHEEISTNELAKHLDLAVLWNGTASMELTSLGVPVMMCGYFGLHDYPIELIYPNDVFDYEKKLISRDTILVDKAKRLKAKSFLEYMGNEEVSIPNHYARKQLLNDSVGTPIWYHEKVVRLNVSGDKFMTYAAEKII